MSSGSGKPFYHYTNGPGLQGILKSGHIEASDPSRGDAVEGAGTYGTNLPPSTRPGTIARNNWDNGWQQAIAHGKLDHYVRCEIPQGELRRHDGHGRDERGQILVHPEGIDLSKYPTKFGNVGLDPVRYAERYVPQQWVGAQAPTTPTRGANPLARGSLDVGGTPSKQSRAPPATAGGWPGSSQNMLGASSTRRLEEQLFGGAPWQSPASRSSSSGLNVGSTPPWQSRAPPATAGGWPASTSASGTASAQLPGGRRSGGAASSQSLATPYPSGGACASLPKYFVVEDSGDSEPEVHHSGCNDQGNAYTSYSDGSYHYDNADGSTYDRYADGSATYTSPDGDTYEYPSAVAEEEGGYHDDDVEDAADDGHGSGGDGGYDDEYDDDAYDEDGEYDEEW